MQTTKQKHTMNYTTTIMEFGSDGLLDFYLIGGSVLF